MIESISNKEIRQGNPNSAVVSVVTVGMNHLKYIKDLLRSLYIDYKPQVSFEMIYVDNCSTDGSIDFIKKNYPKVKVYKNETIKGFGENNNIGVSYAKGKYIAIINPDIIVLKNSIDVLYNYLCSNDSVGIVVPKLLNPDYSIQYSVRSFISLKILFWRILTKGDDATNNKIVKDYLLKDMNLSVEQKIDWGIGAALFMKKSFFDELEGFDSDYFLYMEDEDLCLRSWKKDKAVAYYPKAEMIHNHLRASNKIGKKSWLHIKSMFTFFRKQGLFVKSFK